MSSNYLKLKKKIICTFFTRGKGGGGFQKSFNRIEPKIPRKIPGLKLPSSLFITAGTCPLNDILIYVPKMKSTSRQTDFFLKSPISHEVHPGTSKVSIYLLPRIK